MARIRLLKDYNPMAWDMLPAEHHALLVERADQFLSRIRDVPRVPELEAWAERMERLYGPVVAVWYNVCDWITALMIVRWGEAAEKWPTAFTEKDIERALEWERGKIPAAVQYLAFGGER